MAAISALAELFVPSLVSLIVLMPAHPIHVAGLIAGVFGLGVVAAHRLLYGRTDSPDSFDQRQMR